jgi:hypothetical protein
MMRSFHRRTTPGVVGGKVQSKHRDAISPNYYHSRQVAVQRERPAPGFRHVLSPGDITVFIHLLPNWDELAIGLNVILLDSGSDDCDGWHEPGRVAVCAWEAELARTMTAGYYAEHAEIFRRLRIPCRPLKGNDSRRERRQLYVGEFTEGSARGFQLLHILLHELGHHHDRMTSPSQKRPTRGEKYAELYARTYEDLIWKRYLETFGLD